ncbi:hypothetical protein OB955_18590 [Halobacteria archaeon AArc-m2/3/4]|uniref:DUF1059 domain-containing protein n=1 Tax=Natronoglomus mannanivorans TaxID=2979990 RepID=A0AAP3E306_9EURY|nr:hypothetical protein [Halobacteria archaeon AArc-xg1-1]MCU4974731.1 hypothetical protein [Halobacteria archaeon AArc-m2/3/4]
MNTAHCGECEWTAAAEVPSRDINQAMIDHYVETGHSPIVRESVVHEILSTVDEPAPRTDQ